MQRGRGRDGAGTRLPSTAPLRPRPQDALFGVMYTLLKEKAEGSWKTEMLDVIIHFLQLYVQVLSNNVRARAAGGLGPSPP